MIPIPLDLVLQPSKKKKGPRLLARGAIARARPPHARAPSYSAAPGAKHVRSRERVLVAHESAKACLHPSDGDLGSGGYTKGVLDRGKKRSIGGLKRFALRGNCSGTTFCHEGVKRQRKALLMVADDTIDRRAED